jgi:hypothetical protein
MSIDDLEILLMDIQREKSVKLSYDVFGDIFPPGISSNISKAAAYIFATNRGFRIENNQEDGIVYFIRT